MGWQFKMLRGHKWLMKADLFLKPGAIIGLIPNIEYKVMKVFANYGFNAFGAHCLLLLRLLMDLLEPDLKVCHKLLNPFRLLFPPLC